MPIKAESRLQRRKPQDFSPIKLRVGFLHAPLGKTDCRMLSANHRQCRRQVHVNDVECRLDHGLWDRRDLRWRRIDRAQRWINEGFTFIDRITAGDNHLRGGRSIFDELQSILLPIDDERSLVCGVCNRWPTVRTGDVEAAAS